MKSAKRDFLAHLLCTAGCSLLLTCPLIFSATIFGPASAATHEDARKIESRETETAAKDLSDAQMPVYEPGKKLPKGMAASSVSINISSEPKNIWQVLTNFEAYPQVFKRIKTSKITKRDGNLLYLETNLKPQMFVKNQVQHTISDISASPSRLNWKQVDGNFKHVDGSWDLAPVSKAKTKLTYTLHVDAGPLVPPSLVSFFLKFVQREVVGQVKQYVEAEEKAQQ